MLSLARLWSIHSAQDKSRFSGWSVVPITAAVAFIATVFANTVRISVALQLRQSSFKTNALNADQLHRLEGIFVYFGFLLLLFASNENLRQMRTRGREVSKESLWRLSKYLFPVSIYYLMTLGLPLMNGAYSRGKDFLEHSLFVVITPLILMFAVQAVRLALNVRYASACRDVPQTYQRHRALNNRKGAPATDFN
jgi:hypothetical protein